MRRARFISFFAITTAASAAIVACSLQDGGVLDVVGEDAATTTDATTDTSVIVDSSPPPPDTSIVDAGATFCDLTPHDASFFFCADFDEDAAPYGFTESVTDGGMIVFGPSDASPPNLFELTLADPKNDNSQNALLTEPFNFSDAGDGGISYLSIAFDLRVNAIAIDGAAPFAFTNTMLLALTPRFGIWAPIYGKPSFAPVSEFGSYDFGDSSLSATDIGDGSTAIGEWNHYRFTLLVASDGGPSMLNARVNEVLVASEVVHVPPDLASSRQITLTLGPSAIGPINEQVDFDNVVIRSDKY